MTLVTNLVTNLVIQKMLLTNLMTFLSPFLSPTLSLNSSPYSSPKISANFANQQICHQNHHPIWWPTKCGDENVIKIITKFGESPNKVTNMSPNSSPNLVITKFVTKFVTKHLWVLYGDFTKNLLFYEGWLSLLSCSGCVWTAKNSAAFSFYFSSCF